MVQLRRRLAEFLRSKRGASSQKEFARKVGVAQSTIMRIENQDQNITLKTLEQLCIALKCDIGDLFSPSGSRAEVIRKPTEWPQSQPLGNQVETRRKSSGRQKSKAQGG